MRQIHILREYHVNFDVAVTCFRHVIDSKSKKSIKKIEFSGLTYSKNNKYNFKKSTSLYRLKFE